MCCGFSHGWLAITTRGSSNIITLLNLFKNVAPISLPSFKSRCGIYNYKVTLSADPTTSPNDYVVAAIKCDVGRGLTYIKAGEQTWSYINTTPNYGSVTDITFYKGILYAVNKWKRILSFDLSRSHYPMIRNGIPYSDFGRNSVGTWTYLVKSLEGDLWMVTRSSFNFHVYNLVLDTNTDVDMRMSKIDSLGDNVLFLGDSDSISVPVSCFSDDLQKDSIYYIEDGNNGKRYFYPTVPISYHLGIYNVNDDSFTYHYLYNTSLKWMPVPFWVLPSFQWD
ncbi:hypothetical protein SESBI_40613 [Sesbania bispinosa]|nr:hypothetical protein SESBI_40613 [Sesbania bispinosa]